MMVLAGHLLGWLAHFFYRHVDLDADVCTCVGYNPETGESGVTCSSCQSYMGESGVTLLFWRLIDVQKKLYRCHFRWMLYTGMLTPWKLLRLEHFVYSMEELRTLMEWIKEEPGWIDAVLETACYEKCNEMSEYYGQGI